MTLAYWNQWDRADVLDLHSPSKSIIEQDYDIDEDRNTNDVCEDDEESSDESSSSEDGFILCSPSLWAYGLSERMFL